MYSMVQSLEKCDWYKGQNSPGSLIFIYNLKGKNSLGEFELKDILRDRMVQRIWTIEKIKGQNGPGDSNFKISKGRIVQGVWT